MAQGELGKFGELLSFSHVTARIINPNAKKANANLTNANFSVISLSYLGIDLVCEVPVDSPRQPLVSESPFKSGVFVYRVGSCMSRQARGGLATTSPVT